MCKKSRFRGCLEKQYGKRAQTLFKSASDYFYHIHWQLPSQLNRKKSLLLACQILGLLVNTLPAKKKYPVLNRDNLTIPIQMQLSQKQKTFSDSFAAFLKCSLNFKDFEKKDTNSDAIISEIKKILEFFNAFLKSRLNCKHFEKKDDSHRFCISEITDSKT